MTPLTDISLDGGERYHLVERTEARNAALALSRAFRWTDSPEGYEYWAALHARLLAISEGATE